MKQKVMHSDEDMGACCPAAEVCPLSQIQAGTVVCIKKLLTSPELTGRLREMGFYEEQQVRLLSKDSNYICQICNARLGISSKLAAAIMVAAVPKPSRTAA